MRVLVFGGRAIGGITAAKLDADVTVLDANAEHVAALRDPGLVINDEPPVPLNAVDVASTSSTASSTSRWSPSRRRCTTSRSRRWSSAAGSARSSRWATA